MAVPMWMQKRVRDVLYDYSMLKGNVIIKEIQQKYPEQAQKTSLTGSKIGSNQYVSRGRIFLGIEDEAFDAIENGTEETPIKGKYTQNVKKHKRELGKPKTRVRKLAQRIMRKKPKEVEVKAHKRNYVDMRPVQLPNGDWIIARTIPERKGDAPLTKAINKFWGNGKGMNAEKEIAAFIRSRLS